MKVQVLEEATADLADGYRFYNRQAEGLGEYFLDSLWSDIQSLRIYGGVLAVMVDVLRAVNPGCKNMYPIQPSRSA